MEAFTTYTGRAVPLRRSNVDTDQIIPAVWLKQVSRTGFDKGLFSAWREDPDFVLNQPQYQGAGILVAGPDFGTGSSREHAVWALQQYGWGVPAFVAVQITNRIFFAQQDTRTPMIYGLISVGVNVVQGVALFFLVGVPGIAAATSAAWWLNVLMMNLHLARKKVYTPSPAAWSKLARILAASLAAGVLMAAAGHWRGNDGVIVREDSFVLSLVHPDDDASERAVQAIVAEYKQRHRQEAVLRVRTASCASY